MMLYRFMSNEDVGAEVRAADGRGMPHVRFGQRWSLPDGLEVAVLDVVTPRFIGRREDGVRVMGECSDLRKHGKLVVDVPQRSEREMIANTVYREAEFPPEGMTKKAWLAQMVNETEVSATHRATRAGLYRVVSRGNGFASWNGALELTWPAPVVAEDTDEELRERCKKNLAGQSVAERPRARRKPTRPTVRVGQVWQWAGGSEWKVLSYEANDVWLAELDNGSTGRIDMAADGWRLVRDVDAPKPALSRKVEVGQVWRLLDQKATVYAVDSECAGVVFAGCTHGSVMDLDMGEPLGAWERVA